MKYVKLKQLIDDMNLEIINSASDINGMKIYSSEISRPGLQIVGYFEKFVPERLHIIGNAEWHYLEELSPEKRYDKIDKFLQFPITALIVSRELKIFPEFVELAKKHDRTILRGEGTTSKIINSVINYIDLELAPSTRMHGVFVEIFGVGVLMTGKSGVGKSETALDLVTRGHRLISDDTVIIKKVEDGLVGKSPEITRHFMEIRGLGILDIERLYGVGSVKNDEYIEMVVELESWDKSKEYDRIGLDEQFTKILNTELSTVTIPVRPGRNIAMIVEVATRNFRQRALGYNAAEELNKRIFKQVKLKKRARE